MPDADYEGFCRELADMDDAVMAAFVISDKVLGSYIKIDVPVLKGEDVQKLSDQTAEIIEILKSNERLFGELGFVLVRHEAVDGMFIPVDGSTTVLVGLVKPYDQDKIEQAVRRKIASGLTRKSMDSIQRSKQI